MKDEDFYICQNCIITDGFVGLNVNQKGLCNYCADPSHINPNWKKSEIIDSLKAEKLENWKNLIKKLQEKYGDKEYSCVIGYSGGKDSTALVDTFLHEYNLRPFLITINVGFMTDVAKNNIEQTLKKLKLHQDHLFIVDAAPTFGKLYKYHFLNHISNEKLLSIDVCHSCTDLMHTILVKEAMKMKLDYVFIGFSPDQISRYFYDTSTEDTLRDGLPKPLDFKKTLTDEDLQWFLDENIDIEKIPEVIYPYHVIEYDEQKIIERIESKRYIEVGKGDPVLTNCHVVKVAMMYDLFRYGGVSYALQYAELVRQKPPKLRKKSRKDWLRLMVMIGRQILNNTFDVDGMNDFFKKTGLTREELINIIEKQKLNDPKKNLINRNIDLIREKKLK